MTSSKTFRIAVTPTRNSRKPKTLDQQIDQFEKKLIDLIADPVTRYLPNPENFTRQIVKTLHDVKAGLVVS